MQPSNSQRLAIVSTHPIQYYAPLFQALAKTGVSLRVFYTWGEASVKKYDPDFRREIIWDLPILEGYAHEFLTNTAKEPGSHHYSGIDNPDAFDAIDEFNPDAILVYGWSWKSHLRIIRHYSGRKRVWFRGDSTLLDQQSLMKSVLRKPLLWWIYKHIDLAFYVGTQNKRYYRSLGVPASKLRFAPHAVDNSRYFEDRSTDAFQIRKKLGIPEDGQLILFAGKFEAKKDPVSLLNAFVQVNHPQLYLLFVGNGVLENELKKQATVSGVEQRIFFMEFQNQSVMPALYQACQVFCLPSVGPGETWGLAVNEAMASAKAVVVSDKVGCAVDLVKDTVNGFISKAGSISSLQQCLERFAADRRLALQMGQQSRSLIQAWGIQQQVNALLQEL